MRVPIGLPLFACLMASAPAHGADAPPTQDEIRNAMAYAGLPPKTAAPAILVLSKIELAQRTLAIQYLQLFHLAAIGMYDSKGIYLREDWRTDAMPTLVHEMRHYAQDMLPVDTSGRGGRECDAYFIEEWYLYEHGYPAYKVQWAADIQKKLGCPIIAVPYVPTRR